MKHIVLYIAAALALMVAGACLILIMEMYDLSPHDWGPSGVEFAEWFGAWRARRDRYALIGACSGLAFVVLALTGLWFDLRRGRRLTRGMNWTRRSVGYPRR